MSAPDEPTETDASLRNDSTQALGLIAPLSTFKVKVLLPNSQSRTFEFPSRYTVDRVKTEIFAYEQSLQGLSKLDFQLGLSENDRLKVEFVKFKESSENIKKLFAKGDKIISIGIFPRAGAAEVSKPSRAPLIRRTSVAAVTSKINHSGISSPQAAMKGAPTSSLPSSPAGDSVRERSNSFASNTTSASDSSSLSRRAMSPNRKILQISLEQKRLQKEKEKDGQSEPTSPVNAPSSPFGLNQSSDSDQSLAKSSDSSDSNRRDAPETPKVPILDIMSSKKKDKKDKKDKRRDKSLPLDVSSDPIVLQKLRSKKKHSKSMLSPQKTPTPESKSLSVSFSSPDEPRSTASIGTVGEKDRSPIRLNFGRSRASSFSTSVSSLPRNISSLSSSPPGSMEASSLDSPRDLDVSLELMDDDFDEDSFMMARPEVVRLMERARPGIRVRSTSLVAPSGAIIASGASPTTSRVTRDSPVKTNFVGQTFQRPTAKKNRRASFGTVEPENLLEALSQIEEESSFESSVDEIRRSSNKRLSLRPDSVLSILPLMKVCRGWWVELGDKAITDRVMDDPDYLQITGTLNDVLFYKLYFSSNEHQNYIGVDEKVGPYILSVVREKSAYQNSKLIRTLMRTKKGDDRKCIQEKLFTKGSKSKASVNQIMKAIAPMHNRSKIQLIKPSSIVEDLISFEEKQMVRAYKFGVLYCQEGQTREEEMFSNENGSADFDEFLNILGDTVTLKGFPHYRGGLDNQLDMTGTQSVYTKFRDYEIMYHVSTLLPYSFDNPQQLERKRHLGNDIVVIVFKEGNTPYVPSCISSDFIHVVAVVSVVRQDGKVFYRLSVASKDGVPTFAPPLPEPALFEAGPKFRDILLTKLINGERASLLAPSFADKIGRTRYILLKDLEEKYLKL